MHYAAKLMIENIWIQIEDCIQMQANWGLYVYTANLQFTITKVN